MRRTTSGGRRQSARATTTTASTSANAQIAQRLEAIERLVTEQRQQIVQQEQELAQLRAALAAQPAPATDAATPTLAPFKARKQPLATSRRALLMAGGTVAAAAAVEAVALTHGGPTALAHGAKAELGGVAWQTGTVLADEETLVKPSNASYASNDVLQVQLGTGTVYSPASLKAAITAYDTTTNNVGVYATSSTGYGLYGVTNSGNGATGAGLSGVANSGSGVVGNSNAGIGVSGASVSGLGGMFTGGQAPIALGLAFNTGAPTTGNHVAGEIYADGNAALWLCTASGTPGTWNRVAILASGGGSGGGITYLSKPVRLLDTRVGLTDAHQTPGAPCTSTSPTTVFIAGVNYNTVTIPAPLSGAIGNVTVLNAAGGGFLEVVPSGAGFTGAANLAFAPGQIISNAFNVGLSGGNMDIIIGGANVDVIIDVFAVV